MCVAQTQPRATSKYNSGLDTHGPQQKPNIKLTYLIKRIVENQIFVTVFGNLFDQQQFFLFYRVKKIRKYVLVTRNCFLFCVLNIKYIVFK